MGAGVTRSPSAPESPVAEVVEPSISVSKSSAEFQPSKVRVVRLPQRGGGLPSVGRMSPRTTKHDLPPAGVPTKIASEVPPERDSKLKIERPSKPRRNQAETPQETPSARRAEFTILKDQKQSPVSRGDADSPEMRASSQDSRVGNETPSETRSKSRPRSRRRSVGVTIYGWLAAFRLHGRCGNRTVRAVLVLGLGILKGRRPACRPHRRRP